MEFLKLFYKISTVIYCIGFVSWMFTYEIDFYSIWFLALLISGWILIENKE